MVSAADMTEQMTVYFFFTYFSEKLRPDILYELYARQIIGMKCQALLPLKIEKKLSKCCLLQLWLVL